MVRSPRYVPCSRGRDAEGAEAVHREEDPTLLQREGTKKTPSAATCGSQNGIAAPRELICASAPRA